MTILYRTALSPLARLDCERPRCTAPAAFNWQEGTILASVCPVHDLWLRAESRTANDVVLDVSYKGQALER